MSIHIWESSDAPAGQRFLARMMLGGKFTPMVAHGSDRDELIARVEVFHEAEKERFRTQLPAKKAKAAPAAPRLEIDLDDLL
jgi:hypothetical protein